MYKINRIITERKDVAFLASVGNIHEVFNLLAKIHININNSTENVPVTTVKLTVYDIVSCPVSQEYLTCMNVGALSVELPSK